MQGVGGERRAGSGEREVGSGVGPRRSVSPRSLPDKAVLSPSRPISCSQHTATSPLIMQTLTRLLCLLIWFGRLDPVSAVQKAVRIEVSFDLSPALPRQETYLNSTQHGDGQPSYSINIGLGTPLQFIKARLQLGSSVLLVIDATTLVCSDAQGADNCTGLAYNRTTSTSVIDLAKGGSGWFVGDAVSLAGVTLYDQSFELIGDDYGFSYSEFGLAPGWQYQTSSTEETYPSILTSLVMQERINSHAFSLWMNRNTASTGLLVLGGVDTAAYNDPLITIPMISDGFSSDIFVSWTGLTVTAPNGTLLTGLVADNFSIATSIRNYNEDLVSPCGLAATTTYRIDLARRPSRITSSRQLPALSASYR